MDVTLSATEIEHITGYKRPGDQLDELRRQGFYRARRSPTTGHIILERAHYDAVKSAPPKFMDDPSAYYSQDEAPKCRPPYAGSGLECYAQGRRAATEASELAHKKYLEDNADEIAKAIEICKADSKQAHKAVILFHANKRRAKKLLRTPSWVDYDAIRAIYAEALRISSETGIKHQVDHVFPLQGRLVSGLHVHTNMQILTKAENIRKSNLYEVEV